MKIGIFGDIHGNIEALKVAYNETRILKVDALYHLGDVGGYAPFVNEIVDFLVEHSIEGVQGNYDEAVGNDREHCGCKAEGPLQEEMAHLSFTWTKNHASAASKAYMKNLPEEIKFNTNGKKVWLFHATPRKNNLYWHEDRPDKFFFEMAEKGESDLMIYGHTHKPYQKKMNGMLFVNAGSVGKPKDGDPRACLTVIEIKPESATAEFIRLKYDVEKTATAIAASGLPIYFAERLRQGHS
jgi:putative phosphoesterase